MDLAEFVLRGDPVWTRENLSKALKTGGNEQYISLKEPVQVHLMYWTAWVDERDRVQFREDLYGRDELLNRALHPG
jgi:murein L,D-transpeptidase YcbB/YkuD